MPTLSLWNSRTSVLLPSTAANRLAWATVVGGKTTGVAVVAAVAADGEDTGVADEPPHEPLSAMTSGAATNSSNATQVFFNARPPVGNSSRGTSPAIAKPREASAVAGPSRPPPL